MPEQLTFPGEDPLEEAAGDAAKRLASGLAFRIEHLTEREKRVRVDADWETLPNMPARLIWEAFEPNAAAHFVVYKLMHEARSVLPRIYRALAWELCSAQPERFGMVTYREQLWALLASVDSWPEDVESLAENDLKGYILEAFRHTSSINWFCHREEDLKRDASWIAERLKQHTGIAHGIRLLRRIQLCQRTAVTAGNVILHVPEHLGNLATGVSSQAKEGYLPPMKEIENEVASLANKYREVSDWGSYANVSIPFDLLSLGGDDHLSILALTRYGSNRVAQEELRRRLIYLRFFAHYAFGERKPENLTIAIAFYADRRARHDQWLPSDNSLFHPEEIWSFDRF